MYKHKTRKSILKNLKNSGTFKNIGGFDYVVDRVGSKIESIA